MPRGAKPGNTNALRHGFYSQAFTNKEVEDLSALQPGLAHEIELLRVAMRRTFDLAANQKAAEPVNLSIWIEVLEVLAGGAATIATLLKTESLLAQSSASDISAALSAALKEVQGVKFTRRK